MPWTTEIVPLEIGLMSHFTTVRKDNFDELIEPSRQDQVDSEHISVCRGQGKEMCGEMRFQHDFNIFQQGRIWQVKWSRVFCPGPRALYTLGIHPATYPSMVGKWKMMNVLGGIVGLVPQFFSVAFQQWQELHEKAPASNFFILPDKLSIFTFGHNRVTWTQHGTTLHEPAATSTMGKFRLLDIVKLLILIIFINHFIACAWYLAPGWQRGRWSWRCESKFTTAFLLKMGRVGEGLTIFTKTQRKKKTVWRRLGYRLLFWNFTIPKKTCSFSSWVCGGGTSNGGCNQWLLHISSNVPRKKTLVSGVSGATLQVIKGDPKNDEDLVLVWKQPLEEKNIIGPKPKETKHHQKIFKRLAPFQRCGGTVAVTNILQPQASHSKNDSSSSILAESEA